MPSFNCSGKTLGSPAALKASWAISPETWWWPWPSVIPPTNVDTMTCGRVAPHRQHGVVENAVVAPARERLLLSFRETEVDFGAPELIGAVVFVGLQKLVGADDAKSVVALARHGVLAALAAREREQRAAHAQPAGKVSEQRAVFVVGVGDDHEQAGGGAEALERLLQAGCAAVFGQRLRD